MTHFSVTFGMAVRGNVREYLRKEQFLGNLEFIENKGWIESDFTVKSANSQALSRVHHALVSYIGQLELGKQK